MNHEKIPPSTRAIAAAQRTLAAESEGDHFHPLEAISFFRRWPRSFARNVLYTVIFNMMFALGFMTLGLMFQRIDSLSQLLDAFIRNIVISNVVGFTFWGVFELIGPVMRYVNRKPFIAIVLFYSVLGTLIVTGAFFTVTFLPGYENMRQWLLTPQQLTTSFIISLCISTVLALTWRRRIDELSTQITLAEERQRVEAAERAMAQANLRALQAQIEPHFLFNTLANVVGLIRPQPDTAQLMLEKFIAYLRATLAATREEETTLGSEFSLMSDFLAILQIRMGDRLQVAFDLPADLASCLLPSMLLQPLVENAIKHGLEPKVEGGSVTLKAQREGDMLHISISDTGMGFSGAMSNGLGLHNVRERIDKLYAGKGSLIIEENLPAGTCVKLTIPVEFGIQNSSAGAAYQALLAEKARHC